MEFWFDDGWEEDYSKTLPFLLKNKCTGIAAITTGWVCQPGHMCIRKIRALIGSGWKIASHGTEHKCMLNMDMAETLHELEASKEWIIENLGVEPCAFVAPWNVMRPEQIEMAEKRYPLVREPKTLHFHSNNFPDVEKTITHILQDGHAAHSFIEHRRYLKSARVLKRKFGVDV